MSADELEQFELELINRMRLNPQAELAQLVSIPYANGLPAESYLDTGNRDAFAAGVVERTNRNNKSRA